MQMPNPNRKLTRLSGNQHLIWLGQQQAPEVPLYEVPYRYDIAGEIDADLFCQAFKELVNQHQVLRTIASDSKWTHATFAPECLCETEFVDLADQHSPSDQLELFTEQWIQRQFDPTVCLYDSVLARSKQDRFTWLIRLHHSITDAANAGPLLARLSDWYRHLKGNGPKPKLSPAPAATPSISAAGSDANQWWDDRSQVGEPVSLNGILSSRDRYRHERRRVVLDQQEKQTLQQLIDNPPFRQITPGLSQFVVLMSALSIWLNRITGQQTSFIGATNHGRPTPESRQSIGLKMQLLPFQTNITSDSTIESLAKSVCAEAHGFLRFGFDAIEPELHKAFNVALNLIDMNVESFDGAATKVTWLHNGFGDPKLHLTVSALQTSTSSIEALLFDFRSDVFDAKQIDWMIESLRKTLEQLAGEPSTSLSEIEIITDGQKQFLTQNGGQARPVPERRVWDQFCEVCDNHRDDLALQCDSTGAELTYGDLAKNVKELATELKSFGPIVPVVCRRDSNAVVAYLAAIAAGKCFLPIDSDAPIQQQSMILNDCGAQYRLDATSDFQIQFNNSANTLNLPENALYILYTSGSTGKSNGVVVSGGALLNLLEGFNQVGPIARKNNQVQCSWWTNVGFDVAIYEIFSAILYGHTLRIPDEQTRTSPNRFLKWVEEQRIGSVYFPPFWLQQVDDHYRSPSNDGSALQRILVGVEPIPQTRLSSIARQLPHAAIVNGYGPTEATVCATLAKIDPDDRREGPASIGRAVAGNQVRVVDSKLRDVPPGIVGELLIAGAGLANGYLNRSELTQERFVVDKGVRWYRTGDRVFFRSDGRLQFAGRLDDQIKIRGQRVELGEISAAIQAHDGVRDVAIVVDENQQLVAIVESDHSIQIQDVRHGLLKRIAGHLIPRTMITATKIPRNVNGKVERKKSLELVRESLAQESRSLFLPDDEHGSAVLSLWQQTLEVDDVSANDDFFQQGGNSLLAQQLVHGLHKKGIEASVAMLFANPTLELLIAASKGGSDEQMESQPERLLSAGQREIWAACQLDPESNSYHIQLRLEFNGRLDVDRMKTAFAEIIRRHEFLRAVVAVDGEGEPKFVIQPPSVPEIQFYQAEVGENIDPLIRSAGNKPFEFENEFGFRISYFDSDPESSTLALTLHHLFVDQDSVGIILDEFAKLYRKESIDTEAPQVRSHPTIAGQRTQPNALPFSNSVDSLYEGCDPAISLPMGFVAESHDHKSIIDFAIGQELSERIKSHCRSASVPASAWFLAAFSSLLERYSGSEKFVIGMPVSQRNAGDAKAVGYFLDALRVPVEVSPAGNFNELLQQSHRRFVQCIDPSDTSQAWPHRLQTMLVMQSTIGSVELGDGLTANVTVGDLGMPKFDLTLFVTETEQFEFSIEFGRRFSVDDAGRIKNHWLKIVEQFAASPDAPVADVQLLTSADQQAHAIVSDSDTLRDSDTNVVDEIMRMANTQPHATALVDQNTSLTYQDLDSAANRIANSLRKRRPANGLVAIMASRSVETVVGILGILKAGLAYVPINPSSPTAHIGEQLESLSIETVVDNRDSESILPQNCIRLSLHDPSTAAQPGSLTEPVQIKQTDSAYVIFTSGSSGQPKGVAVSHQALALSTDARNEFYQGSPKRFLMVSPFWFDSSVAGLFWALTTGGTLVIADSELQDIAKLSELICRQEISDTLCLPSLYDLLLRFGDHQQLSSLSRVILAGESLSLSTVKTHHRVLPGTAMFNEYGPTEASVWCTATEVHSDVSQVSIGKSVGGATIRLLDKDLRQVPIGVAGEIFVGGQRLAKGYIGQPKLTDERFVQIDGKRFYRTGDLAVINPQGMLIFVGRLDHQVKINGHRVELGAIESAIAKIDGVTEVAVAVVQQQSPSTLEHQLAALPDDISQQLLAEVESTSVPTDRVEFQGDRFSVSIAGELNELIKTPHSRQRKWMLDQLLNETASNFESLGEIASGMVPGSDSPHLPKDLVNEELEDQEIMEDWQIPLMSGMADWVTESGGDILEIGFGRGVSAQLIQERGVRSHTIVEVNPHSIQQHFHPWRQRHASKDIRLVTGLWQDTLDQLKTYDGIFFHAFPMNEQEFMQYVAGSATFAEHFFPVAAKLLRPGGVFTYLTTEIDSLARRHQRSLFKHFEEIRMKVQTLAVPPDTKDAWWSNSMVLLGATKSRAENES